MQDKINALVEKVKDRLDKVSSLNDLINNIKVAFLGKNGEFTAILRGMKDVPKEDKPLIGKLVNDARDKITAMIEEKQKVLEEKEVAERLDKERIDVTLKGNIRPYGTLHPCTLVTNEIIETFIGLGFQVAQGPEIETDYYNFQALNIPKDHPAREMQDTFYITDDVLLRTHTSPTQIRTMEKVKPPIRVVIPGKVYRPDDDATHSPMFQQIEGLVVDKGITMCDLKGILTEFAKKLFNDPNAKTRLRPSFFPFTEPSVELDVSCAMCHGKGCRLCKGTGWIEVLGAGIVNPKVLEYGGIDSTVYSGFAFGFGIERIAMIKYCIPDMRILFENDVRFLKQFK